MRSRTPGSACAHAGADEVVGPDWVIHRENIERRKPTSPDQTALIVSVTSLTGGRHTSREPWRRD
jgi:hypothetical protein